MIVIPPRHYCVVENPVMRDKDSEIVVDASGEARLCHADLDIRLAQDPFPLYPGETLKQKLTALTVVVADSALRLMAILDFEDDSGDKRTAGDEWLFEGPGMYQYLQNCSSYRHQIRCACSQGQSGCDSQKNF